MTAIRLLIVDDHPIMRDGLRGVFRSDEDFEVTGEASDGAETIQLAQVLQPDVILMDLRMPGMGGVEAITRLRELGHPARVLILTTYDTDRDVLPALEAGATGYLLKDAPRDELIRAVRAVHQGQSVPAPRWPARWSGWSAPPAAAVSAARRTSAHVRSRSQARRRRRHQPGRGAQAPGQRDHHQDPPAAHLHQARRPRPRLRRSRRL
jgi:DNA-binding NarL/FixJ family response regulator